MDMIPDDNINFDDDTKIIEIPDIHVTLQEPQPEPDD